MTTADTDFSLRALVREIAEQNPLLGPGLLARKVAERIPEEHLRDAVGQTMGLYVRQVMHEARPTPTGKSVTRPSTPAPVPASFLPPAPRPTPAPAAPPSVRPAASPPSNPAPAAPRPVAVQAPPTKPATPAASSAPAPQASAPAVPATRPRVISSRKGSEIRDGWQKHLEAEYPVPSGYKKFGDCTYEDLYFLAAERDKQAENLKQHGRYFRGLAGLLVDHDVKTLRELPVEVQMQAVGSR